MLLKKFTFRNSMERGKNVCFYSQIHGYTYNNTNVITALFDRVMIQLKGGYKK